jgi:hypothetical protein
MTFRACALFADAEGKYTVKGEPDFALARNLLRSAQYHKYKSEIMKPIDDFFVLLDERTAEKQKGRGAIRGPSESGSVPTQFPTFCFSTSIRALTLPPCLLMTEANSWRWVSARLRPSTFTSAIL